MRKYHVIRAGMAVAALTAALQAAPGNGLGLTVGGVSASQAGMDSSGASLGVDAQFACNARWSINPYIMFSYERATAPRQNLSDNLAGMQFRYWIGGVYLGPHVFFHDRLIYGGTNVANSQYGPGAGVVLGWEGTGGFTLGAQVDALEAQFLQSAERRTAVRAYVGYRWK